jgi:hypothetical protein
MKQVIEKIFLFYIINDCLLLFLALIDICMNHEESYSYVKYLSVFFHVYYVEKIIAELKEFEQFDNSSINARVRFFYLFRF